jgi:hypothetical protein
MSCPTIQNIQSSECIGNSLIKINNNFTSLSAGICDTNSTVINNTWGNVPLFNLITSLSSQILSLSSNSMNSGKLIQFSCTHGVAVGDNWQTSVTRIANPFNLNVTTDGTNITIGTSGTYGIELELSDIYFATPQDSSVRSITERAILKYTTNSIDITVSGAAGGLNLGVYGYQAVSPHYLGQQLGNNTKPILKTQFNASAGTIVTTSRNIAGAVPTSQGISVISLYKIS